MYTWSVITLMHLNCNITYIILCCSSASCLSFNIFKYLIIHIITLFSWSCPCPHPTPPHAKEDFWMKQNSLLLSCWVTTPPWLYFSNWFLEFRKLWFPYNLWCFSWSIEFLDSKSSTILVLKLSVPFSTLITTPNFLEFHKTLIRHCNTYLQRG